MKNRPLLIAHRGYSQKYPENSLIAFERALANHCDMIELDIHLSKDGQMVVHHDFELGRTCTGKGFINQLTASELRQLDCGSWLNSKFKDQRIPLLVEVLDLVRGRCLLNIEIKHETLGTPEKYDFISKQLIGLVEKNHLIDHVVVSSFDWNVLKTIRNINTEIHLGLLNHSPDEGLRWNQAVGIHPYSYHPNLKKMNANIVNEIRENDLKIYSYTANSIPEFELLCDMGVDGIITNDVESLYHFLNFHYED